MKTVLQVKLNPSAEQAENLLKTMERFNSACDYISAIAFEKKCFSKFSLHKFVYYDVKERFGLSAQVVIRAIGKTVDAYKLDKKVQRRFKPHGAMIFDQRIMSFKGVDRVSLWTLEGRQIIQMIYGEYQKKQWFQRKGQANLIYRGNKFFLMISIEIEEPPPLDPEKYIGVDLGIVEIAYDSDGEHSSGKKIEKRRQKYSTLRKNLQHCGSKSAKRHLKKASGQESRYRRHINHCIAKKLVEKAKRTERGIALENLKNIRAGIRARRPQRAKMHGWSFAQLRNFITYKAKLAGIPVITVNPQNTSRRCFQCGHTEKANRKSQAVFVCRSCGFTDFADRNAAHNISFLASVNARMVGTEIAKTPCNCAIV